MPVHHNLPPAELVAHALRRHEGVLTDTRALMVDTGKFTGRSPKDRFTVRDAGTEGSVWWSDSNIPFASDKFDQLHQKMVAYLQGKELYVRETYAGANPYYQLRLRIVNELAWHNLFCHNLFLRPATDIDTGWAAKEQVRLDSNVWMRANYNTLLGVVALADLGNDRLLGVSPLPSEVNGDGTHLSDASRVRHATLFIASAFQRLAAGERNFIINPDPVATAPHLPTQPVISNFVSTTWSSSPPIVEPGSNCGQWGDFTASVTNPTPGTFNRIKVYFFRNGSASGVDIQIMDNPDFPTVVGHCECRGDAGTEYDSLEYPVSTSNHSNGWRLARNGGTGSSHYLVKVETWLLS